MSIDLWIGHLLKSRSSSNIEVKKILLRASFKEIFGKQKGNDATALRTMFMAVHKIVKKKKFLSGI